MTDFKLHPQLEADTHFIADLQLSRVLLMNNANFPWLILVPRKQALRELYDLTSNDYMQVMQEIRMMTEKFASHTGAYKINVAALGNVVPQLHIHIIARFENDAAWPAPVWSSVAPATPYKPEEIRGIISTLRNITNL